MSMHNTQPAGAGFMLLLLLIPFTFAGAFWAAGPALQSAGPALATLMRFAIATAVLWPVMLLFRRKAFPPLDRSFLTYVIIASLTGGLGYHLLFFAGAGRTDPARAAVIIGLNPAMIALVEGLVMGRVLGGRFWIGMVAALMGALLALTGGKDPSTLVADWSFGDTLMIGAAASWVAYSILTQRLKKPEWDSHWMGLWFATGTSTIALIAALPDLSRLLQFTVEDWLPHLYMGLFPTAIGYTFFVMGIAKLGAGRTSLYIFLVPIITALLRPLISGASLLPTDLGGAFLVFLGMSIALKPAK